MPESTTQSTSKSTKNKDLLDSIQKEPPLNPNQVTIKELLQQAQHSVRKKDYVHAEQTLLEASELDPQDSRIWSNLGVIAKRRKNHKTASEYFNKGLALNPKNADLLSNIGSMLLQLKDYSQALKFLQQSITINDKSYNAWNNIGSCYFHLGSYEEATVYYEKSLSLNPDNHEARFNLSWCLLRIGEFRQGFALYESRFNKQEESAIVKNVHSPRWQYQSIIDQPQAKLCLTAEQGFGDTLQFIRFAPLLTKTNLVSQKQIVIHVQASCVQLIKHSFSDIEVMSNEQAEPAESLYHVPLMSLPLLLKLNPFSITNARYLTIEKKLIDEWKKTLNLSPKAKNIGITWQGSPTNVSASHRSIPLETFMQIFSDFDDHQINLINLTVQTDVKKQEQTFTQNKSKEYRSVNFNTHQQPIKNFADTAAIIENLDLVISIDTSVAHLAGALNKPTFILIPYAHDWRWFRSLQHSPWYPSARLFRQDSLNNWDTVIPKVRTILKQWLEKK